MSNRIYDDQYWNDVPNLWPDFVQEDLDSFVYPSEDEESKSLNLHVKHCTKAERDEYCKICLEY